MYFLSFDAPCHKFDNINNTLFMSNLDITLAAYVVRLHHLGNSTSIDCMTHLQ